MPSVPLPAMPTFAELSIADVAVTDCLITIRATSSVPCAACPACGRRSSAVHGHYTWRLRELPWSGLPLVIHLTVRRFVCRASACPRRTFVEQLAGLTQPHAQRSIALNGALQTIGLALGGAPGTRLGTRLGFSGRGTTILRRVRALPLPPVPAPTAVGVDEWAYRKGRRYGTIIVDLHSRRPIDLLPESAPEPLKAWFRARPTVEVVARDRATVYTDALAIGAPQAQQVADRWHLAKHLGDTLHTLLARHTKELRAATSDCHPPPATTAAHCSALSVQQPAGHIVGPRELREFQFHEIKRMRADGWPFRRIARTLHLHRRTVLRYAQADELPRRIVPQSTSSVTPYLQVVHDRWQRGDCTGPALLLELERQGYRGSLSSLYRALKGLRSGDGRRQRSVEAPRPVVPSPRQAMWLLVRARAELTDKEQAFCAALCTRSATIARAQDLAQRFLRMVRERAAAELDICPLHFGGY